MNICVFGDSVAKGVIFNEASQKYTYLKDNFINITQNKTGTLFKNFAKFGCTIKKGETIMKKQLPNLSKYDYVILEFGGNDCNLNWEEVSHTPKETHLAQVPIQEFKKIYEKLIENIRSMGGKPLLMTLPPLASSKFFNWVSKGLSKEKIMTYLGNDVESIFNWQKNYNNMIYTIADECEVPVIDIRTSFLSQPNYEDLICIDGMHPNEKGHKVIAEALENFISNVIPAPKALHA